MAKLIAALHESGDGNCGKKQPQKEAQFSEERGKPSRLADYDFLPPSNRKREPPPPFIPRNNESFQKFLLSSSPPVTSPVSRRKKPAPLDGALVSNVQSHGDVNRNEINKNLLSESSRSDESPLLLRPRSLLQDRQVQDYCDSVVIYSSHDGQSADNQSVSSVADSTKRKAANDLNMTGSHMLPQSGGDALDNRDEPRRRPEASRHLIRSPFSSSSSSEHSTNQGIINVCDTASPSPASPSSPSSPAAFNNPLLHLQSKVCLSDSPLHQKSFHSVLPFNAPYSRKKSEQRSKEEDEVAQKANVVLKKPKASPPRNSALNELKSFKAKEFVSNGDEDKKQKRRTTKKISFDLEGRQNGDDLCFSSSSFNSSDSGALNCSDSFFPTLQHSSSVIPLNNTNCVDEKLGDDKTFTNSPTLKGKQ
eukprot:GDKJ01027830.1.p1 GENE.GDKJ01027830.1~~GDKJ01027830.1.p1  ORF type:complete len:491 (-),score=155.75 GDKJ01027830.1:159-1418(-)